MTNKEYKEMVEKKYGRTLKEIMYELVINRGLDQWEGSKELGVPKDTFVTWRSYFRFGPYQRAADHAEQRRNKYIEEYKTQLKNIDLDREFIFKEEKSLAGFKELIERMLELEKYRRTLLDIDSTSDLSITLQIGSLESMLGYLEDYEQDRLHKKHNMKLKFLK